MRTSLLTLAMLVFLSIGGWGSVDIGWAFPPIPPGTQGELRFIEQDDTRITKVEIWDCAGGECRWRELRDGGSAQMVLIFPEQAPPGAGYIMVSGEAGQCHWQKLTLMGGNQMDIWSIKGVISILVITTVGGWVVRRFTLKRYVRAVKNFIWKPGKAKYEEAKQEWDQT